MAKQYGSLVGTPLYNTTPARQADMALTRGKNEVIVRDTVELAAAAGDTVSLCKLGWESVLDPFGSLYSTDDLGAGGTVKIGDVTYPAALASAVDTDTGATTNLKICAAVDIANYFKPLWAMLGYATLAAAKAVGDQCELLLTRNTAAGAGTITWQIMGSRRI